ncbi:MAG TPA: glycoside hydrolase [Clostridiaceae bacterium]|nr:glycoside hydrolase [Clostridiaceae bacterium]
MEKSGTVSEHQGLTEQEETFPGLKDGKTENEGEADEVDKNIEENAKENETEDNAEKMSKIEQLLDSMTLEEKVGQVFLVAFRTDLNGNPLLSLDEDTREQIQKYHLGGVILFSENIDTIQQTRKLIEDMQAASKIPMFIAIDEEGGKVSRLNASGKLHSTRLPGNLILGETGDPELAYKVGVLLAEELSSLGFNMNFAPVADVNTNPDNPVIGSRSFGSDPEMVGNMVAKMVEGLQSRNVCSVLKHFPGHGDTSDDTHTGAVIVNHDRKRLESVEFVPFKKGIQSGADGVMTAHIQMPEVTGNSMPATLSYDVLTGILRNDMNFNKLIITDALEMGAISKYWLPGEAAVNAFKAGADILLMPETLDEAYTGLLEAVKEGIISQERLDQSVRRILMVKEERNILEPKESGSDPEKVLGCEEHLDIVREIEGNANLEYRK